MFKLLKNLVTSKLKQVKEENLKKRTQRRDKIERIIDERKVQFFIKFGKRYVKVYFI